MKARCFCRHDLLQPKGRIAASKVAYVDYRFHLSPRPAAHLIRIYPVQDVCDILAHVAAHIV